MSASVATTRAAMDAEPDACQTVAATVLVTCKGSAEAAGCILLPVVLTGSTGTIFARL